MSDKQDPTPQSTQPPAYPPVDPRILAAMYGLAQEDEIDLLAYWRIIWSRRKLILPVMLVVAILSAGISLLLPNVYQAQVLMAPVNSAENAGRAGRLISALGGGIGGLASLAGVSLGSTSSTEENLAVLQSRTFLWDFIKDNKLMPILYAKKWDAASKTWKQSDPKYQPSLWEAYRMFAKKILSVSTDKRSGLVTVAIKWTDPVLAADWANRLVARLNDYLRQQAIERSEANLKYLNEELQKTSLADVRQALFTLIAQEQKKAMIANTQKQYAFQVLDAAAPPDRKAKPHRTLIVIIAMFVSGFLATVFVFAQEGIKRRDRSNEEAAAKP
jgi:uncharacterized protein involved in exopolysaccharide biosynthesis